MTDKEVQTLEAIATNKDENKQQPEKNLNKNKLVDQVAKRRDSMNRKLKEQEQ